MYPDQRAIQTHYAPSDAIGLSATIMKLIRELTPEAREGFYLSFCPRGGTEGSVPGF
jgi:hypothetical protein